MEEKKKSCPFKDERMCDSTCALYIEPEELNETFRNKLKSINVLSNQGMCSLKNIALVESRKIFETSGRARY
ncbi:MAG: hypothetical protein AB7V50_04815 [Vampirovibrionia bacterium]